MKSFPLLFIVAVLVGSVLSRPVTAGPVEGPISFGLIAVQAPEETAALWRPLLAALSRHLGREVVPHVSKEYAGIVWALREGKDQIAWLGGKSAMEAVDNANVEIFTKRVYPGGIAGYYSLLIVGASSPFRSAEEVLAHPSSLTLGWGDRNSTSGFLVPAYHLFAARDVDPRRVFKRVVADSHEGNIEGVLAGRIDVATVASVELERYAKLHPEVMRQTRVVWRSPVIPSDPMVWRKDLPAAELKQIRAFFLGYGVATPGKPAAVLAEEVATLAGLNMVSFIASDDRQLLPVRQIELYRVRLQIEADAGTDAADRDRRMAEIDKKLADISRQLAEGGAPHPLSN